MIWLLHGNLGSPADWSVVSRLLNDAGYPARAVDLWQWLQEADCSLEDVGSLLVDEARASGDQPILCGYSMGGRLALHALRLDPEAWKAGILISTNPGLRSETERNARLEHDSVWAMKCRELPWSDFLSEWNSQSVLRNCPQAQSSDLKEKRDAIARGFESWSLGRQDNFRHFLASPPLPILGIVGENDSKFHSLAQEVWGPCAVVIPGVGHRVPLEAPDALATAMLTWLAMLNH